MYWVDVYNLIRLAYNYSRAKSFYNKPQINEQAKSFFYFRRLLDQNFAISLPYLAELTLKGIGCSSSPATAKYYAERAVRNGFDEYIYLVAVVDYFGEGFIPFDSLSPTQQQDYSQGIELKLKNKERKIIKKTETNNQENESNSALKDSNKTQTNKGKTSNKVFIPTHNYKLEADYKDCFFHLKQYIEDCNKKKKNNSKFYAEALALLGYCFYMEKGTEKNEALGRMYFDDAQKHGSLNVKYLEQMVAEKKELETFII